MSKARLAWRLALAGVVALTAGCTPEAVVIDEPDAGAFDAGPPRDAGLLTCVPCLTASDCAAGAACVQYAGSDFCARGCASTADCGPSESCAITVAQDGTQVSGCIPADGDCGNGGCGTCPAGATCDALAGQCTAPEDAGAGLADAGACGVYDGPGLASCCHSCTAGAANCQANGCYGGWWCDRSQCRCHAPPATCGAPVDAGTGPMDAGTGDGGVITGTVGVDGGVVSRLFFAVVGDTRPAIINDTAHYPTAIVTKIYQDLEAMRPRPQFVVATGDYLFASTSSAEAAAQMQLYAQARSGFSGPVFAAMGNHECDGYTTGNCATKTTANLQAYLATAVAPLGQANPWYTVRFSGANGQWTAKLVVVACNAWSAAQKSWLTAELAKPTTYTVIARHEPTGSTGPCNAEMDAMLQSATYDLLLVGHTHAWRHSGKQLIEGVGGAPISGSANYGYATVEQTASGFTVTQYDYQTAQPVASFTVP